MNRSQLLKRWDQIRASFWFLPALIAAAAIGLAFATLALDRGPLGGWIESSGLGYGGSAEGASAVLQTIASSMMTIAGVVFSMTLVALSLASTQFGPRLLRNFMRDATNQSVLGVFVATFLYSILVLRAIRRADESLFVPHLSVAVGVALALVSLAMLVYFIHHISTSIQADEMIGRVGAELIDGIERMFPQRIGSAGAGDPGESECDPPGRCRAIAAQDDGYLQRIDPGDLMEAAVRCDLLIRLEARPGDYVVEGGLLASAWPQERVDDAVAAEIADAFALGIQRTPVQDLGFSIQQLVEIAVRALSPGVNDPFTALACVDRLASGLRRLARREMPASRRTDDSGRLRVIATPATFGEFVDIAFDPIRRHSRTSAAVTVRLLDAIRLIAPEVQRCADRESLRRQAEMIGRSLREGLPEPDDRRLAQRAHEAAMRALA